MITYLDYPEISAVEISVSSIPSRGEFDEIAENLREFCAECGPVSLCFSVENFAGGLSAIFWNDVHAMLAGLDPASRCAFVTPERWRVWLITSGKVLAPCDARYYGLDHAPRARGWLLGREKTVVKTAA